MLDDTLVWHRAKFSSLQRPETCPGTHRCRDVECSEKRRPTRPCGLSSCSSDNKLVHLHNRSFLSSLFSGRVVCVSSC